MILVVLLKFFGWVLAILPETVVRGVCSLAGDLIFYIPTRRQAALLSNLHHAFPEKSESWRRSIGRESCRRLVETSLFVLASPYFDEKRWRRVLKFPDSTMEFIEELRRENKGGIALVPHLTAMEALAAAPLFIEGEGEYTFGAIYRPFDNKNLDRWVRQTRERFGLRLLSRKKGFREAQAIIRKAGWVGVLFDQNAGDRGALIHFFNRVASATELPAILCRKFNVPAAVAFTRRKAFWRVELHLQLLDSENTREGVTLAANEWLEDHLKSSDEACADWLWLHKRWKTQDNPRRRLRLEQKKSYLEEQLQKDGLSEHPRRTRFWIRMPNWLGDVVMALPLLQAIRAGRPEAEITVLAGKGFLPLLEKLVFVDRVIPLPEKSGGWQYFQFFRKLKIQYPDTFLILTNSLRGDLEAFLTGCPQRFGMLRPGKWRPLLTHSWKLPPDLNESKVHQTRVWEQYLKHFGLQEPLNLEPIFKGRNSTQSATIKIGLICGTENQPDKRWPVERWRDLIEQLLEHEKNLKFVLFGTDNDRPIAELVARGLPGELVENLAGKTDLTCFLDRLRECRLLVGNDTGGIHLANAMGVPTVVVYGPTNPLRTRPVFEAPVIIMQPPGCPPEGGLPIVETAVERVAEAVLRLLKTDNEDA